MECHDLPLAVVRRMNCSHNTVDQKIDECCFVALVEYRGRRRVEVYDLRQTSEFIPFGCCERDKERFRTMIDRPSARASNSDHLVRRIARSGHLDDRSLRGKLWRDLGQASVAKDPTCLRCYVECRRLCKAP